MDLDYWLVDYGFGLWACFIVLWRTYDAHEKLFF